jgi:hypothetical protein
MGVAEININDVEYRLLSIIELSDHVTVIIENYICLVAVFELILGSKKYSSIRSTSAQHAKNS